MHSYFHNIGDYTAATAHLTLVEDAIYRRCIDLYYLHESPLTKDLNSLCRYLRVDAKNSEQVDSLRYVLAEFFKEDDYGYYHNRCDKELDLYRESQIKKGEKKSNAAERQQRSREARQQLFDKARELGITVKWNSSVTEIKAKIQALTGEPVTHLSRTCHAPVTPEPVTPDTAIHNYKHNHNDNSMYAQNPIDGSGVQPVTDTQQPTVKKEPSTKKQKPVKTSLPEDFSIETGTILEWAKRKGISNHELTLRMEDFKIKAIKGGYQYVNWVAAFQDSVNSDWAKLGQAPCAHLRDKSLANVPTSDTNKGNRLGISEAQLAASMKIAEQFAGR